MYAIAPDSLSWNAGECTGTYPDLRVTQGVGLAPDIEVPNSRREILGEDVILQRALQYLSTQP
ncbi:hypothetical protein WJU16_02270 [Chitinophaga pollutisoli]|uniref:Uncharacterized protein n=1 Tax=Chitinophaga pollutisoli TaxID=3133966 RepID=A0ABZ2YSE6_9BACT